MKHSLEDLLRGRVGSKKSNPEDLALDLRVSRDVRFTLDLLDGRRAGAALWSCDGLQGNSIVLCRAQAPLQRCRIDHEGGFWCGEVRFKVPLSAVHRVHAWFQAVREA